jgi:hypothetical protein
MLLHLGKHGGTNLAGFGGSAVVKIWMVIGNAIFNDVVV